jgi:membrane-associated protein
VFATTNGFLITKFLTDWHNVEKVQVAGTLAAIGSNHINIHLMVVLLISAAILGDSCNYFIGKFFGEKLFTNPDSKVFKHSYLGKTHNFYEKHGGKTIIFARFVPIVRTFTPFVAGMGQMTYLRFISFCVAAAFIWVSIFMYESKFYSVISPTATMYSCHRASI